MNESANCFTNQWIDWLQQTLSDAFDVEVNRNFSGGGSGGGASMIRRQSGITGVFEDLPLVIAGGGGGSSTNFSYDFLSQFGIPIPQGFENSSLSELYTEFINAKATYYDSGLFNSGIYRFFGVRGFIRESIPPSLRAGAGGGWSTLASGVNVDGGFLEVEHNFAEGGFGCGRQIDGGDHIQIAISNLHGGFGGGGGQCGGGGGGGGYTGGSLFGYSVNLPGGGGYFFGPPTSNNTKMSATSSGDGYVELVHANCGCASVCTIVNETFKCECPNDTTLAPDEFDCYHVSYQTVTEGTGVVFSSESDDIILTPLYLNQSFLMYGASAVLSLGTFNDHEEEHDHDHENSTDHDQDKGGVNFTEPAIFTRFDNISDHNHTEHESCVLFFLGANADIVLTSNIVRGHSGKVTLFSTAQDTTAVEYKSFLDSAVFVSGALLASHSGSCVVNEDTIEVITSTRQPTSVAISEDSNIIIQKILNHSYNDMVELNFRSKILAAATTLSELTTASTNDIRPVSHYYNAIIIPLGISILFVVGGITFVSVVLCVRTVHHKSRKKLHSKKESIVRPLYQKKQNSSNVNNNSGSISTDSAFTNHWAHTPVIFINEQYDGGAPRYIENMSNSQNHGYESIDYSEYDEVGGSQPTSPVHVTVPARDNAITQSAKWFTTQYGISAPIHDFASYNKMRITDSFEEDWEYPRNKLIYLRELGEGQFGKVLLMRAQGIANYPQPIPVAVKTLSSRDPAMIKKFMEEARLMKKCAHPNIVSLLGVSSHNVNDDSAPLMILEYMPYGDLQSFLESNRPKEGENNGTSAQIGPAHFFSFARDIAEALEFLESLKHVHRDVASRNCLVGPGLQVKLADFGLARELVYEKNYYRIQGKAVLPVRWMAPESLLYGVFTTASDVWSYGVLLWEIVTYGDELPLSELETEEIIAKAETKELSHPRPENCPEDIYAVMCKCHQYTPEDRITFKEIVVAFSKHNIDSIFERSVQI